MTGLERKAETIFVVEDDAALVSTFQRALKERFTVVSAGTVGEACRAVDALPRPTAAVIDGRLPDGKGYTVVHKVHARYPELPLLIMTGYSDDHDLANLAQSIGAEYAVKPGGSVKSFARRVVIRQRLKDEALVRRTDSVATAGRLSLCRTEILALAVAGASREEMALVTRVSINTVKTYALEIGRIYGKPLGDLAWGIQTGDRAGLAH